MTTVAVLLHLGIKYPIDQSTGAIKEAAMLVLVLCIALYAFCKLVLIALPFPEGYDIDGSLDLVNKAWLFGGMSMFFLPGVNTHLVNASLLELIALIVMESLISQLVIFLAFYGEKTITEEGGDETDG